MSKIYTENPGTQPVPSDEKGNLIIDHTGKTFGRYEVVGYHGFSIREHMAGGRELNDNERDLWVVRCECGRFFLMTHDYLRLQLRKTKGVSMCLSCRKILYSSDAKSGLLKLSLIEKQALGLEPMVY